MPLEVVVELQIRAISCPGVFLPGKQDVYLGVYLMNQYLETNSFPSAFPIMIQESMRFEKVFESAVDPGAVVDLLESFLTRFELIQLVPPVWDELAYYEENTRDFLFPEPKLTPSHPRRCREVLMKTALGFPEERHESRRPLSTSHEPIFPLNTIKMKLKENNLNRLPKGMQARAPSQYSTRHFFQDQPAQLNLGNNFKISGGSKPPFVVRHVDSAKPFGENISEHHLRRSRRKSKFSDFPFPTRRASSLDSLAANVKVIKEPDERIVLRSDSSSCLDSSQFGKSSSSKQGDADFHGKASFATYQHSTSPGPLDQPLLRERFHPGSQSTRKNIHERVCSLLTSHRAQLHQNKEDSTSEVNYIIERPSYPLKKYSLHEERYF
ncbi:spermatogenesis associated 6-like protein isoform X2 [Pan troglodytes]|uniref:spermatogenesis associated 6-like protein isoform X2 n=1 Tax=Pan troglodytes TaxID=9598 RepID=UPI0007DBAA59|nr:spermatogenesis associated 6-like protein isoform X2 [Pan troglodytes]XP_054514624.1 spermatogenesis associated 6-like protein isoform X2 [Pan troglodytes]